MLRDEPGVERFAVGDDTGLSIEGEQLGVLAMDQSAGPPFVPVIDGRPPARRREIALGARTMRDLDVAVGETVAVRSLDGGQGVDMAVVGSAAIPATNTSDLGRGAVLTFDALREVESEEHAAADVFLVFAASARAEGGRDVLDRLERRFAELVVPTDPDVPALPFVLLPHDVPADIVNFGRIEGLPFVLAAMLAAVAVASLAYMFLTSARRRQRDLAVLKTLGFRRGQLTAAVVWQAAAVIAVTLAVGLPLGIAAGRGSFDFFAGRVGVVSVPQAPYLLLLAVAAAALSIAATLAALTGRSAAGTPVAQVLRAE